MGAQEEETQRNFWYRRFAANNLDVTRAFYQHPKILITALNGPAIGLSAALIAHSDFIYCTKSSYLFTPFTSLGLTAEGGSSATLVHRLGLAKANEALLLSKKITSEELLSTGFVNDVFPDENDASVFHSKIVELSKELFGDHLNRESILKTKQIVRAQFMETLDKQNLLEIYAGLERFVVGAPQGEFMKLASGEKKVSI
jgi:Delta3-Delta2-enoyl-CoA isomerase